MSLLRAKTMKERLTRKMITLKRIIAHPAAIILSFVPFVNLVYFLLILAFAPAKKLFPYLLGMTIGSAAIFWLSNRVVPVGYEFLVFYAITVLLSTVALFLLRSIMASDIKFSRSVKLRLAIGIALILIISLTWFFTSKVVNLQPQAETMLQAIIDDNEEAFRSVSYGKSLSLESVQQELAEEGINLQGSIQLLKTEKLTVRGTKGDMTKVAEYIYQIGKEEFFVRITYRDSGANAGVSEIVIIKN